ncbi:flagellar basal-body MS-ring/collar protein FliF [Lutispora thermophila]|uniref:Flagellar M-ring protein n=1 Tax=Lutispora thermophila DSM 19022 TaxID=1122184 RepID=A0A1M6G6F4_9FIRM|nr:flagellar basal-body MS-ring/collar protein FliF [Lutispora thermophila]SHJ05551.1 flagellar M-ring protein FliF [Lutispora thermophila DSM 19022]
MGEAIKKVKDNLNEFWQGLEKGQKIRIAIISTISVLLIVSIGIISAMPRYQVLYPNLDAKDAGEIKNKLQEMKIPVKVDGTTILVPKDKVDEARINLAMEGLPKNDFVFPEMLKSSFNDTSQDKKLKQILYMQNTIANGIKSLDGVEWAQVNLFIPDDNVFVLESNRQEASASVIIKTKAGYPGLDEAQVNGIAQYISKSVKGLKEENITIIDENGRSLKTEGTTFSTQVSTQMEMQEATRINIQNSVRKFLESVYGVGNVNVMATVKLNFDEKVETSKEFKSPDNSDDNAGLIRSKEESSKQWTGDGSGGVPGTDSNTEIPTYVQTDESESSYNESSRIVNYEINEFQNQIVKEKGYIENLSLSILIDNNAKIKREALRLKLSNEQNGNKEYYKKMSLTQIEKELKDKNDPSLDIDDEEIKNITELALKAVKGFGVEDPDSIHVMAMDFDTSIRDLVESETNKDNTLEPKDFIPYALAALVLAGAMIYIYRRNKKYEEKDEDDVEMALSKIDEVSELTDIDNEVKKKVEKFVSQKPEQAAQLLKTWLNEE